MAIIAEYVSFCVFELWWHRLSGNIKVILSEREFHVHHTFAAKWAFVRSLHVSAPAKVMNAMATSHEHYRLRGCEHVFTANRTIAVSGALDTFVAILDRH